MRKEEEEGVMKNKGAKEEERNREREESERKEIDKGEIGRKMG